MNTDQPITPDAHSLIDEVCDELDLLRAHLIGADTLARTVKLGAATIARVLIDRGGWTPIAVAELLGLSPRNLRRALWALDTGHLDTVAAYHDWTTAAMFVAYIEALVTLPPPSPSSSSVGRASSPSSPPPSSQRIPS